MSSLRRVEGGHVDGRAGLDPGRIHKILSSLHNVAVALSRVTIASGQERPFKKVVQGVADRGQR